MQQHSSSGSSDKNMQLLILLLLLLLQACSDSVCDVAQLLCACACLAGKQPSA
jgi:hypothetical protein